MDNKLLLTVLFVMLSWKSLGTYAQNSTPWSNVTANMTMTTMNVNMTGKPHMTTMDMNMTGKPHMTTMDMNMTGKPHMTTMDMNMTGKPHMTTMNMNMTGKPHMTTMDMNMTGKPHMTTMDMNMTGKPHMTTMDMNMTGKPNVTAATVVTEAPPLTPNTTVEDLKEEVDKDDCGTEQLCAAEPSGCDPSTPGSCFFLAVEQTNGQNFEFALSGESEGYLAASLSPDNTQGGNDTTYVCANDNGVVKFFGTVLDNGKLIQKELNVNNVKGKVNGNKIQCTFAATVPTSVKSSNLGLSILTGPYNSTSGELGAPKTQLQSPPVNLANPNATITNVAATTASPATANATANANATAAPATTANATAAPATTANATAAPATTTAAPITAAPVTTAVPPLIPNTTVEVLQTPINNADCGIGQLCAAQPADCDPSKGESCFFLGAKPINGQNFEFALSGQSDGYVAASVSPDATSGGNDPTFVCANINGAPKFFSTHLGDDGKLTEAVLNVNNVKAKIDGRKIQCTFRATVPAGTTRVTGKHALAVLTGIITAAGRLGIPVKQIQTALTNLGAPGNIANLIAPAATTPAATNAPTTSHAITLQQSLMQALLITVGVLFWML